MKTSENSAVTPKIERLIGRLDLLYPESLTVNLTNLIFFSKKLFRTFFHSSAAPQDLFQIHSLRVNLVARGLPIHFSRQVYTCIGTDVRTIYLKRKPTNSAILCIRYIRVRRTASYAENGHDSFGTLTGSKSLSPIRRLYARVYRHANTWHQTLYGGRKQKRADKNLRQPM